MDIDKYFLKIDNAIKKVFPPANFSANVYSAIRVGVFAIISFVLFIGPTILGIMFISASGIIMAVLEFVFMIGLFVIMIINMKDKEGNREAEMGIIVGLLPHIYLWINFFSHNLS